MIRTFSECDTTLEELASRDGGASAMLSAAALRHLIACPGCRAGLLLLLAETPPPATCAHCQEDLAAFIDLESVEPADAAREYPAIWWHLWLCSDCAETYQLTKELLAAEAPSPDASQPAGWLAPISLARAIVLAILPRRFEPALGMRGTDDQHVLFDAPIGTAALHQCTILVDTSDPAAYQLRVELAPPLGGTAELHCGGLCVRGQFDADGVALLAPVPAALFVDASGPDFKIIFY